MFHVKRSREGEMFHVKQKRVAFRSPAGGVSGWSPADLAFSLLFCPHPPDPRSQSALPGGKGEIFVLFCRGLTPPAPLQLNPRSTGSIGGLAPPAPLLLNLRGAGLPGGSAPCIPGAEPGRHWLNRGGWRPRHPCYRSRAALVIPSGRNYLNITGSTLVNAYL